MVVALVAGIMSSLRTPLYRSTAQVLLRPNDPTEQLNPDSGRYTDPDRYVNGQRTIIESEAVAREAAKLLPPGTSLELIEDSVSVAQGGRSDVLNISATDTDPVRAKDFANAVAKGYIENRRQAAVSGLERAAKDIEDKLGPLLESISRYDAQIAGEAPATAPEATNRPQTPTQPATQAPTQPTTGAPVPSLDAGGAATAQEALKAARYSAALQYETLFSRQQELLVDISLKRGEAEIVADAKTGDPLGPNPLRDAAMGAVVGLLLGVGVSFLREQLDDRLRSAEEVERVTGKTVLAQLPLSDDTGPGKGVAAVERPLSPLSEAVRSLRTSVQYASIDQPVKVVMVTSASPGEGKSLVAANLAVTFAQSDRRTILVSGDLRRATLDELFLDKKPATGLTTLVLQQATALPEGTNGSGAKSTPAGALVKTGVQNLLLLPSGPVPPNPAEIMGSRRLASLLDEYSAAADMLIIDTPPLLPVTDAAVLAERVDGVVVVVALNETRRDGLKRAMAILEGTGVRVLGVVVNKTTGLSSGDYYAYYGDAAKNGAGGSGRRWPLLSKKADSASAGAPLTPSRSPRSEVM